MKNYYLFIGNTSNSHTLIAKLHSKNKDTTDTSICIFNVENNYRSYDQSKSKNITHNKLNISANTSPFSIQTLQKYIDTTNKKNTNITQIQIIITCYTLSTQEFQFLYSLSLKYNNCLVYILPKALSTIKTIDFAHLKKLSLEDILFDISPMILNLTNLSYFKKKRVLITGAGGTFGSEIAIQLLHTDISALYLLGHGEYSLYTIYKKLTYLQSLGIGTHIKCIPVLCELQDKNMVEHTMTTIYPHILFHTAAHKHVDLIEKNPIIGISSNIFVTQFIIDAALKAKVQYFVYISTDKSVEPVSLYGASKLVAEEIVYNSHSKQKKSPMHTVVVRSGNILGSRGSILPLFCKQIENNNPITVTSKNCTRFFIHCSELTSTLLHYIQQYYKEKTSIIALYNNKEVSIYNLATSIYNLYNSIMPYHKYIQIIGLREGEKITEKFTFPQETLQKLKLPEAYAIKRKNNFSPIKQLTILCNQLYVICYKNALDTRTYQNHKKAISLFKKHIQSFQHLSH